MLTLRDPTDDPNFFTAGRTCDVLLSTTVTSAVGFGPSDRRLRAGWLVGAEVCTPRPRESTGLETDLNTALPLPRVRGSACVSDSDPAVCLCPYRPPPACYSRHQQQALGVEVWRQGCGLLYWVPNCVASLRESEVSWIFREHKNYHHDVECSRWRRFEVVCPSKLQVFFFPSYFLHCLYTFILFR